MTVGILAWLAIVVPVTFALAVRRRLRGGARWVVGVGASTALLAALWLGSWTDRKERLRHELDDGTRWGSIDTPNGAHVHVDVVGHDAIVLPGGLGVAPAGRVHRLWFLDADGEPLVAMDVATDKPVLRDRPELARAVAVLLVQEPAGSPRPAGTHLGDVRLRGGD